MMEEKPVWIGIDVGTTSVKISVASNEGKELSSRGENTNADTKSSFYSTEKKGFEQCPQKILKVVESAVKSVLSDCNCNQLRIKGIGISGQMHGLVLWKRVKHVETTELQQRVDGLSKETCLMDYASAPSHLYTWQDQRCSPSFLATLPKPSNSKLPLSTGHGCATLFWLSHTTNDMTLEEGQFDCCGTIIDYIVYLLCGLDHPVTSDQLAASLGYFNQTTMGWDSCLDDCPEFPRHMLPLVIPAGTQVGVVRQSLSGWPSGVPVLVGMGDVQCAMAALIKSPHQAAVNISTSIQLGFLVPSVDIPQVERHSPPSITFFPYFGQEHLALCAGLNGGNAIQCFVDCVANWMRQLSFDEDSCTTSNVFSKLQSLAAADVNNGNNPGNQPSSLTVRPSFHGERHDPDLCGSISNISLTNFHNIGHVFHSVCVGVVNHLSTLVPPCYLRETIGIRELLVCGSVPERNPFIKSALQHVYCANNLSVTFGSTDDASQAVSSAHGAARIARNVLINCDE